MKRVELVNALALVDVLSFDVTQGQKGPAAANVKPQ
jgi:cold shock CspA family protein